MSSHCNGVLFDAANISYVQSVAFSTDSSRAVKAAGACLESILGVIQVFFQWFMFSGIFVLYLLYFPAHLKFVTIKPQPHPGHTPECDCETCELARKGEYSESTSEWKLSVVLACVVAAHFLISLFTTFFVVLQDDRDLGDTTAPPNPRISIWATFLGVSSTALCMIQEGTDWTSWAPYAAAGIMQGMLLLMCLRWKRRQAKLNIDDYGRPLAPNERAAGIMQGMLLLMCLRWKRRQAKLNIDDYGRPLAPNERDERTPLLGPS
ncbi:unnamed protein product [Rhizoctonia solani]|uniref:Uncharacterized protein n=1 Tax=Rhizoctonia solani TaxID=456999 RepID=A0A8H3AKX8_9AGAM|nr:unnamed protein product [Rhizoctonia solani]